jgi:hypothetical protein
VCVCVWGGGDGGCTAWLQLAGFVTDDLAVRVFVLGCGRICRCFKVKCHKCHRRSVSCRCWAASELRLGAAQCLHGPCCCADTSTQVLFMRRMRCCCCCCCCCRDHLSVQEKVAIADQQEAEASFRRWAQK